MAPKDEHCYSGAVWPHLEPAYVYPLLKMSPLQGGGEEFILDYMFSFCSNPKAMQQSKFKVQS